MKTRSRGWAIIALDLIIILGVYFIFIQYQGRHLSSPEPQDYLKIEADGVVYGLKVHRESEDRLRFVFSLKNESNKTQTVTFPEGVNVFLTDQDDYHIHLKLDLKTDQVEVNVGEKRSWQRDFLYPQDAPEKLYGALYIDDDREGIIEIP
ncbi:MAG: hypothetical protein ACLFN5_07730 [bacterium]